MSKDTKHSNQCNTLRGGHAWMMVLLVVVAGTVLVLIGIGLGIWVAEARHDNLDNGPVVKNVMGGGKTVDGAKEEGQAQQEKESGAEKAVPYRVAAGRSPLPQAGEKFDRAMTYQKFDASAGQGKSGGGKVESKAESEAAGGDGSVVGWEDAGQYVGKEIVVEGKIINTYFSTKDQICFLNFTRKRSGVFYVVIFKEAMMSWSEPPEKYFLNKRIRVSGKVWQRGDRTQIRVTDARQIRVVE